MRQTAAGAAWVVTAMPLLVTIVGAIGALVLTSSPSDVFHQLGDAAVKDALLVSLKTTAASLVIIVVAGTGLAVIIHRSSGAMSGMIELIATLPAILPPSVVGIALLLAFGRNGMIGGPLSHWGIVVTFTPVAVVMTQVFVGAPLYVRELAAGLQTVELSVLDAARMDGANGPQLFWSVFVPILSPFWVAGGVLAWARGLGEFGATLLFAGSFQGVTQTLPIAIYLGFESNLAQAKAIAVVLLACATVLLVLLRVLLHGRLASLKADLA